MNGQTKVSLAAAVALCLSACASTPTLAPEVVRLQDELARVRTDDRIAVHAEDELIRAERAVDFLVVDGHRLDDEAFDHRVYMADRLIAIAEAEGLAGYAEERTRTLASERESLLLDSRTREANRLRAEAEAARIAAAEDRAAAEAARTDALAARQQLELMRSSLAELQAKETERGLVVTLGDVLFELDRAELKPGAARNLDQLAASLRQNPTASIEVEGHTDSTGGVSYNKSLSEQRAAAVRDYLVSRGVDASRINARGVGPEFPVATNATEAGRQQNRRVEVIIESDVAVAADELLDDE